MIQKFTRFLFRFRPLLPIPLPFCAFVPSPVPSFAAAKTLLS
ncbi:MAG TPA: hypothetical protein VK250_11040 [Nitrososphaeraceae archaeon]|nr:hypothetical protein [Nitrososphaeraceae archaeon]